ncbi:MAG: hypothetical protein GF330_02920 [Candidatus Eisenbacteria bacterium]|nr:hypothetical protein [Candidatus Eisenbacteria bacterium]
MVKLAHSGLRKAPLLLLLLAFVLSPLFSTTAWAARESASLAPGPQQETDGGTGTQGADGGGPGLPHGEGDPDDLELTPTVVESVLSNGKYVYLTF